MQLFFIVNVYGYTGSSKIEKSAPKYSGIVYQQVLGGGRGSVLGFCGWTKNYYTLRPHQR